MLTVPHKLVGSHLIFTAGWCLLRIPAIFHCLHALMTCFFNERSKGFCPWLFCCHWIIVSYRRWLPSAFFFVPLDSMILSPSCLNIPPATSLSECHLPPCTAGHMPALKRIHVQLYKLKLYFTWYKSNCGEDFLLIRINVFSNVYSFESKFKVKHHHCGIKFIPLFVKSKCALWTGLLFLPFSRDFCPPSGQGFCCLWQPQVPRHLAAESCAVSRRRTAWSLRPAW